MKYINRISLHSLKLRDKRKLFWNYTNYWYNYLIWIFNSLIAMYSYFNNFSKKNLKNNAHYYNLIL